MASIKGAKSKLDGKLERPAFENYMGLNYNSKATIQTDIEQDPRDDVSNEIFGAANLLGLDPTPEKLANEGTPSKASKKPRRGGKSTTSTQAQSALAGQGGRSSKGGKRGRASKADRADATPTNEYENDGGSRVESLDASAKSNTATPNNRIFKKATFRPALSRTTGGLRY